MHGKNGMRAPLGDYTQGPCVCVNGFPVYMCDGSGGDEGMYLHYSRLCALTSILCVRVCVCVEEKEGGGEKRRKSSL